MYKRIVIIVSILVCGNFVFGQVSLDRFAINPKLGIYSSLAQGTQGGVVIGGEINTAVNNVAFSIDYYRFEEAVFFGDSPNESYNQLGFMVGKIHGSDSSIFSLQMLGGLAPFWGKERTSFLRRSEDFFRQDIYETETFKSIGLVFKMGFKITPLDAVGVGLDIQGNINHKRSVFQLMLSIEIGDLK